MAKLHSIETMGLVDGPGIRTVFFLSGCPLRCVFCHNPDTQNPNCGSEISVEELVAKAKRYKPYFKNGGGVTISGGEPLASADFLLKAIRALHEENIHVAVDTSGIGNVLYYDEIIKEADLFLLDIKHYDKEGFKKITGLSNDLLLKFMEKLENTDTRIWIRHVMMPGVTDSKEDMQKLVEFISPLKKNIDKLEILPYHTMGVDKYKKMGLKYKLEGMAPMDKQKAEVFERYAIDMLKSM